MLVKTVFRNNIGRLLTVVLLVALLSMFSCRKKYTPRPMGYLRFQFPEHIYQSVSYSSLSFEKPEYMLYTEKKSPKNEHWFDLTYPHYGIEIHYSYKPVKNNLKQLTDDVHYFVYKHTIKSSGIDEFLILYPENKVYGILYRIRGDVASNIQFVVTIRQSIFYGARSI